MPSLSPRFRSRPAALVALAAGGCALWFGVAAPGASGPPGDGRPAERSEARLAQQAAAAPGARNPHRGLGIGGVENNPIRSTRDFLGERIVLDQDTPMRWFITGFNLEGVHYDGAGRPAPSEIRSSRWNKARLPAPGELRSWSPGDGRIGYANGNGGTIWFRLVATNADGTPDFDRVIAQERINAVAAYKRSKREFGTGLTQLIGLKVDRTVPAGEYVAVFGNVSRRPLVHFFSLNLPTHTGSTPNTRNERRRDASGALGGLDPREAVMWSTSRGRSWVFGSRVGRGRYYGYYSAGRDRRVPWYGWQRASRQKAVPQQPFIEYGRPRAGAVLRITAPESKTLTRAGGFSASSSVGTVTVQTSAGRASTTTSLGRGLSSGRLERPLWVGAGETYTITSSGAVPIARADRYVRSTFGQLPWSTNGEEGDRAQLFAE